MPTMKVKQRGSRSKTPVAEHNTQIEVIAKNTNGPTSGRLPSQRVRFFPVPSRWALRKRESEIITSQLQLMSSVLLVNVVQRNRKTSK